MLSSRNPVSDGSILLNNRSLTWNPPTRLGTNIVYTPFWNDGAGNVPAVPSGQLVAFRAQGVSWVRNLINIYAPGGGATTTRGGAPGADFAIRNIHSVRPLASDPSQLQLTCDGATYAIAAGENIVLSTAISYTDSNGVVVTLPARTPIAVTGGTAGLVTTSYATMTQSTVNVAAGQSLADSGAMALSGSVLLHLNFYANGTTVRGQVLRYVQAVAKWLAAGFWIDHAGGAGQSGNVLGVFGLAAWNALREQEWSYFASLGWDPTRVLISDFNELSWNGYGVGYSKIPATELNRKSYDAGYGAYFKNTLYPRMRHHFPQHTLGFGCGHGDSVSPINTMTWWPKDSNTLLRIHMYLDVATDPAKQPAPYQPVMTSGLDTSAIAQDIAFIVANQKRLGIPQVYFQEFGLLNNAPNRSTRLASFRKAILAQGWLAAAWGTESARQDDYFEVGLPDANGVYQPTASGVGAWGLD